MEVRKNELGDVLEPLDVVGMRCRKSIADGNEKIAQVAAFVTAAKMRIDRDGEPFPGGFDHWIQVYVINPPWDVPRLLSHGGWQEAKKPGGEVAEPAAIVAKVEATKAKTRSRSLERNKRAHAFSAAPAAPQPIADPDLAAALAGRSQWDIEHGGRDATPMEVETFLRAVDAAESEPEPTPWQRVMADPGERFEDMHALALADRLRDARHMADDPSRPRIAALLLKRLVELASAASGKKEIGAIPIEERQEAVRQFANALGLETP